MDDNYKTKSALIDNDDDKFNNDNIMEKSVSMSKIKPTCQELNLVNDRNVKERIHRVQFELNHMESESLMEERMILIDHNVDQYEKQICAILRKFRYVKESYQAEYIKLELKKYRVKHEI